MLGRGQLEDGIADLSSRAMNAVLVFSSLSADQHCKVGESHLSKNNTDQIYQR